MELVDNDKPVLLLININISLPTLDSVSTKRSIKIHTLTHHVIHQLKFHITTGVAFTQCSVCPTCDLYVGQLYGFLSAVKKINQEN